jgi:hypothetical protein
MLDNDKRRFDLTPWGVERSPSHANSLSARQEFSRLVRKQNVRYSPNNSSGLDPVPRALDQCYQPRVRRLCSRGPRAL